MATMKQTAHGSIERIKGKPRYIKFGVGDEKGRPRRFPLPEGCSESMAQEKKRWLFDSIAKGTLAVEPLTAKKPAKPAPAGSDGETVATYADRWILEREGRGLSSTTDDTSRLRKYVLPHLGALAIRSVTRADVESVVEHLDALVLKRAIRWKTAINIFGLVSKLFDDACASKVRALRARDDNPAQGVRGPDRGEERQASWLYPTEADVLLSCEAVPLRWRVSYAVAMYTGLRRGELVSLRPSDVSLDGGYLSVTRSTERRTRTEKSTKGRRGRRVPIEPALLPLLTWLTENPQGPNGALLDLPTTRTGADKLRDHLRRAGVTREELFADDDHRRPLTFHDGGRHTYATWLALSGVDVLVIQRRGGWKDTPVLQRYVAEAEAVGRGNVGAPFAALPAGLVSTLRVQSEGESSDSLRKSSGGAGNRTRRPAGFRQVSEKSTDESANPEQPKSAETGATDAPSVHDQPVDTEAGDGPILDALRVAAAAGDASTIATLSRILALRAEERRAARLEADGVVQLAARRAREGR